MDKRLKIITLLLALIPLWSAAEEDPNNQTFTVNGISFNMIEVEGGTFTMGAAYHIAATVLQTNTITN